MIFFDRDVLKMVSILAAMTSVYFNSRLPEFLPEKVGKLPVFDVRVWNVPCTWEAPNYFIWREVDAVRNSKHMAARSMFSHNDLHGKSSREMQDMMMLERKVNWNDYPSYFKRGTYVQKRISERQFTVDELDKLPPKHEARRNPDLKITRADVLTLELPPLTRVANREEVILRGEEPVTLAA